MSVTPIPRARRVATARELGEQSAEAATSKAEEAAPGFADRALQFVKDFVAKQAGPVAGEDITLAARQAGLRPADDRAFGSVYAAAIRKGYIQFSGHCNRVRGHGTSGGKLYVRGENA